MPIHASGQHGLFDHVPAQSKAAGDEARRMARHYIAELEAATTMRWDEKARASATMVVTNATSWLPAEERDALRAAFAAALARHDAGTEAS